MFLELLILRIITRDIDRYQKNSSSGSNAKEHDINSTIMLVIAFTTIVASFTCRSRVVFTRPQLY